MFKLSVMRKFVLLLSLTMLLPVLVQAQPKVDVAGYKGKGTKIEELQYNSQTGSSVDRILIYNVGKDMFLNAGGFWGTRTATFTVGLPIMVVREEVKENNKKSYKYRLRGPFSNSETGNSLGVVETAGGGDRGVYYDRGTDNAVYWRFEEVSKGDGGDDYTYRICVKKEDNTSGAISRDYMLLANEKMEVEVFESGNYNLVRAMPETYVTDDKKEYSYWKIVTTDQMINEFDTEYEGKSLADASFLMRAQNFNRMNMYNLAGATTNWIGWCVKGNFEYDYGKPDIKGYDHDNRYGMFYCGGITKGKTGEALYQKVEIPKSGWYRVDCQGFFYNRSAPDSCLARLYAKKDGAAPNTAGYAYVDLLPRSYGEPYKGEKIKLNEDNIKFLLPSDDGKIINKIQAGVVFYEQIFPNKLLVYVNVDEQQGETVPVEIGIEITGNMEDGDLLFFDDFQLKYLGESFALDEGDIDFLGRGDAGETYNNRVMVLKRTLAPDKWNSICLPVDLTKTQLNTAFFPNPMLAKLCDSKSGGAMEFVMVDLSKVEQDGIALRKGECYLIKPGYGGRKDEGEINIGDAGSTKITAPYYLIDCVSLAKAQVKTELGISDTYDLGKFPDNKDLDGNMRQQDYYGVAGDGYKECRLRVYGTFQKKAKVTNAGNSVTDNRVPAGSYTFVSGTLYHLPGNYSQKGFSCWIEDEHQIVNPAKRHSLSFTTYINGVSDNTTSIEGFSVDTRTEQAPAVYNIHGQVVRCGTTSTAGLPHGVYIVSGRKVAIM